MAQRLYVGNLPYNTTEAQLRDLFAKVGDIKELFLSRNRYTSKSNGFAFVEMASEAETQKAITLLHGYSIADRPMTVQPIDRSRPIAWTGSSSTVIYRKRALPEKDTPNDDPQS
ncbi:MAG: RNA-binding protein [Anaerolineae bacterium]|nr:RNA-binding protein [Anaerolineae bacterium]NUQ03050.1 RNA-binding protein [Anaerolineae bacterium]